MKKIFLTSLILMLLFSTLFAQKQDRHSQKLETLRDSISYSIGISMGESLLRTDIDDINQEIFFEALREKLDGEKTLWGLSEADKLLMSYIQNKRKASAVENNKKGKAFLEKNAKRENVFTTPSGLQYEILNLAEGERPSLYSKVSCLYVGKTIEGKVFDEQNDKNSPMVVKVSDMIEGWVEALQMMPVGSKWRLYIPAELAYGERGAGRSIGANETLIFDIELLEIITK